MNTRQQINTGTSALRGADDFLPQEFREMIAAMDIELAAHMQTLTTQVTSAGVAHRETLRRLDTLLANWGLRLQNQYEDARQRVDGVQKQYESTLEQFEAFTARYDSVQEQLKGVEQQYEGTRQEQGELSRQMQGLRQQFETTLQQCQALLAHEQRFKDYAETILAFDQHLAGNNAELASLRAVVTVSRRWERIAVAASILALIAVGYISFGKPG